MSLMIKPGKSHIVTLVISYYSHSSVPLNVGGDQLKGMTNRRPFIRETSRLATTDTVVDLYYTSLSWNYVPQNSPLNIVLC